MKAPAFSALLLVLCVATSARLTADDGKMAKAKETVKETAHDVADATKKAAVVTKEKSIELYDKAAAGTKHAAEVVKEKSKDAYVATKEATIKAKDKTVETSKAVAEKTVEVSKAVAEKSKVVAEATKQKAIDLTTTKEELAKYDADKDGHLNPAERAAMKAEKEKEKEKEKGAEVAK